MKKIIRLLILLIIICPSIVFASSNTSIEISCEDATVGETFSCKLYGYVGNAEVVYFQAKYLVSSIITVNDFKYATGLSGSYESGVLQINSNHPLNSQFEIGSFELKATREGVGTITIQDIEFRNNDSLFNAPAKRVEIKINSVKTTISTQTAANSDVPMLTNLYIVGYPIEFDPKNRHYTIDVPYDLDELYIIGNSYDNYTVDGTGIIKINKKGNTELKVVVKKDNYISNTYIINVRKTFKNIIWYVITIALFIALVVVVIISMVNKRKIVENIYKNNPELRRNSKDGVLMNGQMVSATAIPVKTNNESFRAVNTSNLLNSSESEDNKEVKKVQVVTKTKEAEKVNTLDLKSKK